MEDEVKKALAEMGANSSVLKLLNWAEIKDDYTAGQEIARVRETYPYLFPQHSSCCP